MLNKLTSEIEDIYSFVVNPINIFIECNGKTSVFSRVQSTSENLNIFITQDDYFMVFTKNE